MSKEVRHKILDEYGEVDRGNGRWPIKVRLVIWNDGEPKVDARLWSPSDKPSKGLALTKEEARKLGEILMKV